MRNFACLALAAALATGASAQQWSDNFDSYANGQQLHGMNGWKGWDNSAAAGALVSNAQSASAPNSVNINGGSDLVHQYAGNNSGQWVFSGDLYVPGNFTGQSYFILLNTYNDSGPYNWSTQVVFDGPLNQVVNTGVSGGTLPLIRDQWVPFRVDIDLGGNTQAFFYNNTQLYAGAWLGEVSSTGGVLNVGAVDLFANGASAVYYDNLALVPEPMTLAVLGLGALGVLRRRRK